MADFLEHLVGLHIGWRYPPAARVLDAPGSLLDQVREKLPHQDNRASISPGASCEIGPPQGQPGFRVRVDPDQILVVANYLNVRWLEAADPAVFPDQVIEELRRSDQPYADVCDAFREVATDLLWGILQRVGLTHLSRVGVVQTFAVPAKLVENSVLSDLPATRLGPLGAPQSAVATFRRQAENGHRFTHVNVSEVSLPPPGPPAAPPLATLALSIDSQRYFVPARACEPWRKRTVAQIVLTHFAEAQDDARSSRLVDVRGEDL